MKKSILTILSVFIGVQITYSQGCSDAGICSIGNSFTTEKTTKNLIETGAVYGVGDADVTSVTGYITYSREFTKSFAMSVKVTYFNAKGDFGTRGQFGDAYLISNYKFAEKDQKQWSALAGFKFPFTTANAKINDVPLPMDYQASLGTFDLILGVNYNIKQWDFNAGLQLPVFNNNKNSYFAEYSGTDDFNSTNLFERKPDALFRATYTYATSNKKWSFKPNVLFIYHLGEDIYENIFSNRETIKNSDGLTLNGNLITIYQLNSKSSLELSLATPFVVRDERPDGLTRAFTAGVTYKISF
ncbi:hypothetical protein [Flavobacterium capsici]|uniref:Uncharacterized protein n=1 Tax=Flavobacterium capsici TaxID=3075618 RepID=A0AA96EUB5_9FLAO|nr:MULTISPECIES: hypothetical protein [unclassified Flavobacterium]WNM17887.1 hypothetical protein RN608_07660 [Flavobacterium sp. PMR2A8]WNM21940.1 hypothetical protein RN605_00960 [Flavobacterium sp. PMTSA4]